MSKYGFGGSTLQTQNDMSNWGIPKNSFNLDPMAGQDFGTYMPEVSDFSMGGGPAGSAYSGSALGDVIMGGGNNGGGGMFSNFLSTKDQQGWGGTALGVAQGLAGAYLGMKQYGLAKDTLKHNKEMFAKNFDAQKRTTNASLEDRQRARLAGNGGSGYESVSSYMDKNGIK